MTSFLLAVLRNSCCIVRGIFAGHYVPSPLCLQVHTLRQQAPSSGDTSSGVRVICQVACVSITMMLILLENWYELVCRVPDVRVVACGMY